MPYFVVWKFTVSAARVPEFVRAYGPDGDWAELFRRAEGYLATVLVRDRNDDSVFVTIDSWVSQQAYAAFHTDFAREYANLDRRCERLTEGEAFVAHGDSLPQPATATPPQSTGGENR